MSLTDLLDSEMAQSFEAQGIIESERFKRKIFVKSLYLALLPSCGLYLLSRQPSNYPITASVHFVFLATATRFIILCREQEDQKDNNMWGRKFYGQISSYYIIFLL